MLASGRVFALWQIGFNVCLVCPSDHSLAIANNRTLTAALILDSMVVASSWFAVSGAASVHHRKITEGADWPGIQGALDATLVSHSLRTKYHI